MTVTFTVTVSDELAEAVRNRAAEKRWSVAATVRNALADTVGWGPNEQTVEPVEGAGELVHRTVRTEPEPVKRKTPHTGRVVNGGMAVCDICDQTAPSKALLLATDCPGKGTE